MGVLSASGMLPAAWHGLAVETQMQGEWMGLNMILAVIPAAGTVALFAWRGRRGWPWWVGAVTTLLMLPNAPYVLTDVIHLMPALHMAPTRAAAYAGVIPLFVLLFTVGVLSYTFVLHLLRRDLRQHGWSVKRRVMTEALVDLACAVGVALGRIPRLNSWDVLRPHHLINGLSVVVLDPRAIGLALVGIVVASVTADRLASGAVHAVRDRRRH